MLPKERFVEFPGQFGGDESQAWISNLCRRAPGSSIDTRMVKGLEFRKRGWLMS